MQEPEKWSGHLWQQLKSPKVWVSVVIAVLVPLAIFLYAEYRAELKTKEENALIAKQLKVEIDYRAGRIKGYLYYVILREGILKTNNDDSKHDKLAKRFAIAVINLTSQVTSNEQEKDSRLFFLEQFSNQNMASLLLRLTMVSESDSSLQKTLREAIASALSIKNIAATMFDGIKLDTPELIEETERLLMNLGVVTGKSYLTNGESSD